MERNHSHVYMEHNHCRGCGYLQFLLRVGERLRLTTFALVISYRTSSIEYTKLVTIGLSFGIVVLGRESS